VRRGNDGKVARNETKRTYGGNKRHPDIVLRFAHRFFTLLHLSTTYDCTGAQKLHAFSAPGKNRAYGSIGRRMRCERRRQTEGEAGRLEL
jgi:hypothetical protein